MRKRDAHVDTDLRLGNPYRPRTPTSKPTPTPTPKPTPVPPSHLGRNVDGNAGFVGELSAAYEFGGFRLEGTVGYGSAGINKERLADKTTVADGQLKSVDLDLAAYVDLNPDGVVNPFVDVGASRVSADVSRLARTTGTTPPKPGTPAAPRAGTTIDRSD